MLVQTSYDEDGDEGYRRECEYDKNGNMTAEYEYFGDELDSYTEYSWFKTAKKLTDAQINVLSNLDIIDKK